MSKSNSINKTTAAQGVKTMNTQGSPIRIGVNPNKGMPASGNFTGSRGGMPGINPANGGKAKLANVHMGQAGSGHDRREARRSTNTGYSNGKKGC